MKPSLFDTIGRELVDRLPPQLRAEVLSGSDRAMREALAHMGAPHLEHMGAMAPAIFGAGSTFKDDRFRRMGVPLPPGSQAPQAQPKPHPSAPTVGTPHPMAPPAYPQPPAQPNGGSMPPPVDVAAGGYDLQPPSVERAVRRVPYTIWGQTALAANEVRNTDPNVYLNGTGFPFVATHATFSEDTVDDNGADTGIVRVNPSFRANVYPEATRPWGKQPIDVGVVRDNMLFGQIPTDRGFQLSHWKLDAPFRYERSGNFYIAAQNKSANDITVAIALIANKLDTVGSPRVFTTEKVLPANGVTEVPLDASQYKNDGDFDCVITDVVITGGTGTWGAPATSPLILIRPWQPSGLPDWTSRLTMAVGLNTRPGAIGSYWKLPVTQRTPPGTAINVQLQEALGVPTIANIGFVGYLEVPL